MQIYLKKVISKKRFVDVLKVPDENSRIRIHKSEVWIRGSASGSVPKFYGSATLVFMRFQLADSWYIFIYYSKTAEWPDRWPRMTGLLMLVNASYCTGWVGGRGEGGGTYHAADVSVECDVVEVVAGGGHLPRVLLAPVTLREHFLLPARSRDTKDYCLKFPPFTCFLF